MINGLPVAAAVASALFTRRFRFIGVLARVGFRVLAIRVHTSTGKEKRSVAVARAAREVDRVRNPGVLKISCCAIRPDVLELSNA